MTAFPITGADAKGPEGGGGDYRPQDMVDSECIHPACGCGDGPCKAVQQPAPAERPRLEGGEEITGPIRYVAVRFGDKVVTAPMPGFRHHHILIVAHHLGFKPASLADQGFALADETFIGRKEAARLALESGQVKKLIAPPDLYSEDIW